MSVAFIPMTAESNAEGLSDRRPGTLLFEMLWAQERGPFSPPGAHRFSATWGRFELLSLAVLNLGP